MLCHCVSGLSVFFVSNSNDRLCDSPKDGDETSRPSDDTADT